MAATSGVLITGSVKYFRAHPDDFGAMVRETVHCVQSYGDRSNPGWLVEGIADYDGSFPIRAGEAGPAQPEASPL